MRPVRQSHNQGKRDSKVDQERNGPRGTARWPPTVPSQTPHQGGVVSSAGHIPHAGHASRAGGFE
jgi:hypothetical protein